MFLPTFCKHNSFLIFFPWCFFLFKMPGISLCSILLVCISYVYWLHDLQQTIHVISAWFLLLVFLFSWHQLFFPVLALLIGYIPAHAGFSNALFPPRLPHLDSFLNEHQFCPSVQALGFQCVHSSYKAFLSCGVSSGVISPPPAWLDSSDSNKRGSNFPVVILGAWIQHGLQTPWTLVGSAFEWSKLGKRICKMSRNVTKLFQIEMFQVLLIWSDLKTSL